MSAQGLVAVQHAATPHKVTPPKVGKTTVPVLQRRHDDKRGDAVKSVWAVRLMRNVHEEPRVLFKGQPITYVDETWLDGRWSQNVYRDGKIITHKEDTDMAAVSAARTADTLDFGRFTQACTALVRAVDAAGPDPSEEQQESILRSYQGLLRWREDLATKVLQMDGALDVAAAKVRQAMQ